VNWELACLIMAALWGVQAVALGFWFLPRAAQLWQWQGYWLGRKDQASGAPVPAVMLPPREGSHDEYA
jgi:hypothetical protein